jgi:hypothetical protein
VDEDTVRRWYGEWAAVRPEEVGDRLAGFAGPWWIAGGWAVEAFTGVQRRHQDIDVSIFRRDAEALRLAVADRYTCWSVFGGALRPFSDVEPAVHPDAVALWLRPDASSSWEFEVPLNPDDGGRWVNRRLPEHTAGLDDVTWVREDGIRFLNPEVALLFKAKYVRPKDEHDLDAALPLLSQRQRTWLGEMVARTLGEEHPWVRRTLDR